MGFKMVGERVKGRLDAGLVSKLRGRPELGQKRAAEDVGSEKAVQIDALHPPVG